MIIGDFFFLMESGLGSEVDSVPEVFHPSNTVFPGNIVLNLAKQNRCSLLKVYSCSSLVLQLEVGNFE